MLEQSFPEPSHNPQPAGTMHSKAIINHRNMAPLLHRKNVHPESKEVAAMPVQ